MNMSVQKTDYSTMNLRQIALAVAKHWKKPYFGAVPYIEAMSCMDSIEDDFGMDSGRDIIAHFLSNSNTFRGEEARAIKAELKRRFGKV